MESLQTQGSSKLQTWPCLDNDSAEDGPTLTAEGITSLKQFKSRSKKSAFCKDEVVGFIISLYFNCQAEMWVSLLWIPVGVCLLGSFHFCLLFGRTNREHFDCQQKVVEANLKLQPNHQ